MRMIFRHESGGDFDLRAHAEDLYRAHVPSMNAPRGGLGNSKEPVEKFQKRLNRVKLKVSVPSDFFYLHFFKISSFPSVFCSVD